MGDLSPRAATCLGEASLIACEDTRRTGLLLSRLGIKKPLVTYNDVNEESRSSRLVETVLAGDTVAVVSDAGTPGISDPAYRVVRAACAVGITVVAVPGPSALLAALVVSGLPLDRFVFEGFLPPKSSQREKRLSDLVTEPRTIILYESPHRIVKLLSSVVKIFGDREVSVSRELTKLYEETIRGTAPEVLSRLEAKKPKGEYTVVIRGVGKR
jgi:16S rRNA (cytidine1402-2'-O)-methyltransferase